ncbi:MAG: DUF3048 domain-containing protein [Marmoricola sp.]
MTSPISKARLGRVAAAGLAITMAGTLAACGSSHKGTPGQLTSGGASLEANWPLTGLPQASQVNHPIMVVKIPHTPEATPQRGMNQADMVSEELVEGGITRLAVFFDSMMPSTVGPVRSMRASDIGLVKPTDGILVSSGAAAQTIGVLNRAHQPFIQEDESRGFFRVGYPRVAPYNLLDRLSQTVTYFQKHAKRPGPYFDFSAPTTKLKGAKATKIAVQFSGYRTTRFAYTKGHYVNTNSYSGNQPFLADTVLVLRVKEGNAGYLDPAGNPVPESILIGTGSMTLFHNGVAVQGTWSKRSRGATFVFKTLKGKVLQVPAGRVYLELCPRGSSGGGLRFS